MFVVHTSLRKPKGKGFRRQGFLFGRYWLVRPGRILVIIKNITDLCQSSPVLYFPSYCLCFRRFVGLNLITRLRILTKCKLLCEFLHPKL